jgi:GT2 family glycosyltransferase
LDSFPPDDQFNKHHAEGEEVSGRYFFACGSVVWHQISEDKRKWQHTFSVHHHMHWFMHQQFKMHRGKLLDVV